MPSRSTSFITYQYDWFPEPLLMAETTDRMATELADLQEPLQASVLGISRDVAFRFHTKGDGQWAPWAVFGNVGPDRPYSKTYKGGQSVLIDTEDLLEHVSSPASYIVAENTITYNPLRDPADVVLSEGSAVRNIYDRPFAGLDEAGIEAVMLVFGRWLDAVVGESRLMPGETLAKMSTGIRIRGRSGRFVKA